MTESYYGLVASVELFYNKVHLFTHTKSIFPYERLVLSIVTGNQPEEAARSANAMHIRQGPS
jgi:hypothetical protein